MNDLFGNLSDVKEKTFEDEYKEYINSSKWKLKRKQKLAQAGERCGMCGISKWSSKIDVHHRTYDHFKNEPMEDLEVLCPACHVKADELRIKVDKEKRLKKKSKSSIRVGFENWMDRGNNQDWRNFSDSTLEMHWGNFLDQLAGKTGRRYHIPFWRNPEWYDVSYYRGEE